MRQKNKNHQTLNDGVLFLGRIENIYDNANKKIGETFEQYEKLFFEQMSKRDQDFAFADSIGATLDLKVKVYKRKLTVKDKVKLDNVLYDIIKYDDDKIYNFLYLQVVKND